VANDSDTNDGTKEEAGPSVAHPTGMSVLEELEAEVDAEGLDDEVKPRILPTQLWGADPPGHTSGYVAIVGRPNAGKSTLMNAMVGAKLSIVTSKAQTTRHRVLGIVSEPDSQMILLDTPGVIDKERNKMEGYMMNSVKTAVKDADLVIAMIDASGKAPKEALEGLLPAKLLHKGCPLVIALNKCDLLSKEDADELLDWYQMSWPVAEEVIQISAKRGINVTALQKWATDRLPIGPSLYPKDVLSEHPERFFIAEIVREQLFIQYRQEVPYAATVRVLSYEERKGKDYVSAEILVDRDAQKGIIIGKGGAALKKLGEAAREEIELFIDKEVFLELTVKVLKNWMGDDNALNQAGLFKNFSASSDLS